MYTDIFPAAFNETRGAFVVAAMTSNSYGSKFGDPLPTMALVKAGSVDHRAIHDDLMGGSAVASVKLLGGPAHGVTRNPPVDLAIFFLTVEDCTSFENRFELEHPQ
jgi:hypothetical protein